MNKKGDLSINIIVIAAIALLVLIILAVLILRTGERTSTGTSCVGGNCVTEGNCDEYAGYIINAGGGCQQGYVCCMNPIGGVPTE